MKLSSRVFLCVVCAGFLCLTGAARGALVVPFTEDFSASAADWRDAAGTTDLTWNAAGGPDGGSYASGPFNFVLTQTGDQPAVLRGHDEYGTSGSSGGAFVGDWLSAGASTFSVAVRHNAPMPLTFFTRFAGPLNFPGAAAVEFVPVQPNTWTTLSFDLFFGNPQIFLETGTPNQAFFDSVFGNIGHVQVGVQVPSGLAGLDQDFTFDLDKPSITPEPTAAALAAVGLLFGLVRRRRR